jgi:hypothetical protein
MLRKLERKRYEQAAWRAASLPMEGEVPEPTDDTQARTDEYPQTEAQRADDRDDRQAALRAASLPTENEVPDPPGADIPPLEPVSFTPASPG